MGGDPIIPQKTRDAYHKESQRWYWMLWRYLCGRWYDAKRAVTSEIGFRGFLTLLYVFANVAILVTIFSVTVSLWEDQEVWWWLPFCHALGAVIIVAYNVGWYCLGDDTAHEVERRQLVAKNFSESGFNPDPNNAEWICSIMLHDIQETLNIKETEARVMLIAYSESLPNYPSSEGGYIWRVARDHRPRVNGWLEQARPAMASFAYECIRLERDIAFHDHKSKLFRRFLGEYCRSDVRSFLYLYLRSEAGIIVGIIALMSSHPYAFWPKSTRTEKLTERLFMYRDLARRVCDKEVNRQTSD